MMRGIAVHHRSLIPLIVILFQEKWIKALIATQKFAIGLNMPARTVLFHSLRKFDGMQERVLDGGDFTQMSGRDGAATTNSAPSFSARAAMSARPMLRRRSTQPRDR
jgi:superfamily II RNA helicase